MGEEWRFLNVKIRAPEQKARRPLHPTLICIDVMEHRLDVVAVFESALFFATGEALAELITPPTLEHEAIPDLDLFLCGALAFLKAPFEHFVIRTTRKCAVFHIGIIHGEKSCDPFIEALAKIRMKVWMQFPGSHKTDFIHHASEVDDSTDLFLGRARVFHTCNSDSAHRGMKG